MTTHHHTRTVRRRLLEISVLAVLALMLGVAGPTSSPAASASSDHRVKPTVVLVHGAFADASGWNDVVRRLQQQGYPVLAPANPLRGVASDSGYLASILQSLQGPIILVGHSYGGVIITNSATGNPNVKAPSGGGCRRASGRPAARRGP